MPSVIWALTGGFAVICVLTGLVFAAAKAKP
jgi:hypothetical protein